MSLNGARMFRPVSLVSGTSILGQARLENHLKNDLTLSPLTVALWQFPPKNPP
jgi:hypothetical protein